MTTSRWSALVITAMLAHGGCSESAPDATTDTGPMGDAAGGSDTGRGDAGTATPYCPVVEGVREVVLIPVSIAGDTTPCTTGVLDATWLSGSPSVTEFYTRISAGRLTVTGTATATVSIGAVMGCIGMDPMMNQQLQRDLYPVIDAAAAAQGITVPAGASVIYALPESIKCGARGPAASALPPLNRIYFYLDRACQDATISSHEFGHLLGTNHAMALSPSGMTLDNGDGSDIMGNGFFPPNGPHRAQLGWLTTDQVRTVTVPSGPIEIAPLGDDASPLPQLIRFERPSDPGQAIFLSYRAATGPDAALDATFVNRTSIHEFVGACPSTMPPVPKPLLRATVGDGETHSVAADSVTIRQLSSSATGAIVEIAPM